MSETPAVSAAPRRRAVLRTVAWAAPTVVVSQAVPAMAVSQRELDVESNFGIGWYPSTAGSTASGLLQFDSDSEDKYFRVHGTLPGDVLSDIHIDLHVRAGTWGSGTLSWTTLPGSSANWTVLQYVDTVVLDDSFTYDRYRSTYTQTVVATGDITNIPIGFYFTHSSEFYSEATARTFRYLTVNGTIPLQVVRASANIVNTNNVVGGPSHPRPGDGM